MDGPETVLVIEDDPDIAEIIRVNLIDLNLESDSVRNGNEGLRKALERGYALIILDLTLPGLDGLTVCTRIRETDRRTPIIMLTARGDETDRVVGLELGADDYVTKPFSVRELTARVRALLRRSRLGTTDDSGLPKRGRIAIGELVLDSDLRTVTRKGVPVELTVKEFELLSLFMRNPGRTFSRTDLLLHVWGYRYEGYEHTVNSHINRLRSKIEEDPGNPQYLLTVWGIGYRFAEHPERDR